MSVEEQVSSIDNPLTFQDLHQDFYDQRVSSQVTEGTLGIYEYTVRRFCLWADEQGFNPSAVELRHVRAYIALLSSSGYHGKASVDLHGRNIRALLRYGRKDDIENGWKTKYAMLREYLARRLTC
jgi:hypothetical protein